MKTIANVRVGKPDTIPTSPAHTRGVHEGNAPGNLAREPGIYFDEGTAKATARRSTGIAPEAHNAIDPRMPNLPPP